MKFGLSSVCNLRVSRIVPLLNEKLWICVGTSKDGKQFKIYRFLASPTEPKLIIRMGLPFILTTKDSTYIMVNAGVVRNVPMFYKIVNNTVYITDDVTRLIDKNFKLNLDSFMEFLSFGYVFSNRTLLGDVYTLQAGEVLEYKDGMLRIYDKFLYDTSPISRFDKNELMERLWNTAVTVFKNLCDDIKRKTVIVPLSGGLDSRFVAAMLKFLKLKNVICINYGTKGNYESPISKMVADKLGYEWLFIEYSPKNLVKLFTSKEFVEYAKIVTSYHTTPNIQEFPSTFVLKEEIGNKDCVFIPGHTGDFLSGGHITEYVLSARNIIHIVNAIIRRHYERNWPYPKKLEEDLMLYLNALHRSAKLAPYQLYEIFDWRERQSKYIINTSKAYEFFGYQWAVPLWDKRFVDFWSSVPLKLKYNKKLYKNFLREYVFGPLGVDFENALPNTARRVVGSLLSKIGLFKKGNPCGYDRTFLYLMQHCKGRYSKPLHDLRRIKECYGIKGYAYPASPAFVSDFVAVLALNDLNKIAGEKW